MLTSVSLGGNATSGIRVDVRDQQRDHTSQHGVAEPIQLGNPDPLRGIIELLGGDLEQIAAGDGEGLHRQVLALARLVAALPT
jgi:hypothetical protein